MSERIEIFGQHPPMCTTSAVLTVNSSMPVGLASRIQAQAWQQFVMQSHAALRPVGEKMGRLLLLRPAVVLVSAAINAAILVYIVSSLQSSGAFGGVEKSWRDMDEEEEEEEDGGMLDGIPIGVLLFPLAIFVSIFGRRFVMASLNTVAREATNALAGVCSRATFDNPGLTFEAKSDFHRASGGCCVPPSANNLYFVEVTWSTEAPVITTPVIQPMPCQPLVQSMPGQAQALVVEATVVGVVSQGGSVARFCSGCGAARAGDAKFCGNCGRQLP